MNNAQVRVTLEAPFRKRPNGEEQPLSLRYGTTEARLLRQNSSASFGGLEVSADEFVDAGSFLDKIPRSIRRMQPGKPITWELMASDPGRSYILVPVEAARLWFGDWRYPTETEHGTPPEMTYSYERNRVAQRWGWWQMPQVTNTGKRFCSPGEMPDMSKIGPPSVPRVLVQDIDERGNVGVRLNYRPWDHFKWEDDVTITAAQTASAGVETFSLDQLKAIVSQLEAHQKAQKTPTKG